MRSAAAGSGALLVLEGPPGIGKTALLTAVGTDADGFTVLHARGGDLETGFPFGVVRQLFERRLVEAGEDERRELLAGAAALAAPLLGFDEVRRWAGADVVGGVASYPRLHGLYWLAANLAAERPLLLVVDDLHWVDAPSLRWISYLASRVHELPILLLVATRPPEALPEGSALVEPIVSAPEARMIRPGPLSGAAVAAIVAEAFGTEPGRRFCAACHTATGGNPFLLRELLVDLRHAGLEPTDASAGRVGEAGPASVARSVRRRLAATDTPSIALAQTVALLGSRAEHRHVAALLGSTSGDVTTAAASLVDAGILEPDLPLRFVHPVVQAAIHAGTPAAERVDGHARAARLLAGEDAAPEEIGMHLLATPAVGDPWVVDQLRGAAAHALAQGAPAAAAGYLRRALDEAPPDAMRRELLAELGHAEVRAGEPTAVESLSAALAEAPDRERHAGVALELGRALLVGGRLDDAVALLAGVLDGTPALDPDTALRLEAELITASRLDARSRPLAARRLASIRPDLAGARPGERLMLAHLAYEAVTLGEPAAHAATLARRALAGGTLLAEVGSEAPTYYIAASALSLCDHLREADAALTAAQRAAQEAGSAIGFAIATSFRASVRVRQGALVDAEADARSVLDSAEHGWHPLGPAFLVDALVERGALDEAETILESIGMLGAIPENMLFQPLLYARGDLRIAQGRLGEGVEDLLEGGRRAAEAGIRTPAFRDYRSSAAHGLARLGRVDEARGLAREELELARRFGAPRALAIALRCAGQLEGGVTGLALLRDAADAVAGSEAVLERARCLLELGAATRRAGRRGDACPPLREALEIAHACGADPLAEQARTELAAAGSRPRRPARSGVDALTASERRVAHLATEGMTNREIAQALFVTLKTVEWHLAHAYRKLGIAGRAQLASALGGAAGSSSRASPAEAPVPTPAP